jgi:rhomboid protease GluP
MPLAEAGYVPPDPDEPPPLDLATAVGHTPPFATVALLLAWGVVFALMAFRGEHGDRLAYLAWGASATGRDALDSAWRLLASTFVHAGAAHVAANAVSMLLVGPGVERVLGRGAFLSVAALGGAAASLASLVWRTLRHPDVASVSVGASGVVFALGGAFLVGAYRLRGRLAPTRARAMGAALLFLLGQSLAAGFSRHGTDNVAHAVGLVAGALAAVAFPLAPRLGGAPQGTVRRVAGVLAGAALAVALGLAIRGGLAR